MKPTPAVRPSSGRTDRRKKCLSSGLIVTLDGAEAKPCVIEDISGSGARLRIHKAASCATESYLVDLRERVAYRCAVAWRTPGELGVSFSETMSLGAGLPPSLRFLARYWLEHAAR